MVDLTFTAGKDTSIDELNDAMQKASESDMKGILGYTDEPLVSIDFNHTPNRSVFDATGTKVLNDRLCRVVSWYDNEWGFSMRMLDVAEMMEQYVSEPVNKLAAV